MSAAVDDVVNRSGRLDVRADIIGWVRLTIRECEALGTFDKNWVEDQITPTADPHTFDHPIGFRAFTDIVYPHYVDLHNNSVSPRLVRSSKITRYTNYMYNGPNYTVFGGHGGGTPGVTALIDIGYLKWSRSLPYYATVSARPARFDLEQPVEANAWLYHDDYDDSDTLKETARNLVTNWVLFDWYEVVLEGTLSKLFRTYQDPRSVASYAAYRQGQNSLINGEKSRNLAK